MKLIAEIDGEDGRTARLTCDGENLKLTVGSFAHGGQVEVATVPLDEFRKALDAVAPKAAPVLQGAFGTLGPAIRDSDGINPFSPGLAAPNPYLRNPDGSRIGPSPRDNMRARPAEDEPTAA